MTKSFFSSLLLLPYLCAIHFGYGQKEYKVHSHNDYLQEFPFWFAYTNKAASIEVDIFLNDDTLYVAHEKHEIDSTQTIESLYLEPLNGLAEAGKLRTVQLLIDIKTEPYATLKKLVSVLGEYPLLVKKDMVRFVISGNRPNGREYGNYPDFIWFDHQNLEDMDEIELGKVALISLSFNSISQWNGHGRMVEKDLDQVRKVVKTAKKFRKPFRFWATPDTKTAWRRLAGLGVAYINTDSPGKAHQYLENLDYNSFQSDTVIVNYTPKYNFESNGKPSNLILMIGDGNGLAEISAAMIANKGVLNLNGIKDIGLVKTHSHDDLITDSAAGATAMATGTKTNNRHIGVDPSGNAHESLIEILEKRDFNSAIVTTDAIYGATPSSFYAHRKERDDKEGILEDLNKSDLDLFVAGGKLEQQKINSFDLKTFDEIQTLEKPTAVLLGDEKMSSIMDGRKDFLPKSVGRALKLLNEEEKPFILVVEGAQIDNGGHSNDFQKIIGEMLDFDEAIGEALKFADQFQNSLVIITADHETSGLGILGGNLKDGNVQGDFLTADHTGILVPIFAYGPGSYGFRGILDNTEIFGKILTALKIAR